MQIEIHFNQTGNTIIGNYSAYRRLDAAMQRKAVFVPSGYTINCELPDFARLCEYVELFGNCIKSLAGFRKACELAGVKLERSVV